MPGNPPVDIRPAHGLGGSPGGNLIDPGLKPTVCYATSLLRAFVQAKMAAIPRMQLNHACSDLVRCLENVCRPTRRVSGHHSRSFLQVSGALQALGTHSLVFDIAL